MKKTTNIRRFLFGLSMRIMLVLGTVATIVWFLPRSEGRMFHYDEGRPWMYGELIAKFDFPIFKSEEALKAERDSTNRHFQPYYNIDNSVGERQVKRFREHFKGGMPGLPPASPPSLPRSSSSSTTWASWHLSNTPRWSRTATAW